MIILPFSAIYYQVKTLSNRFYHESITSKVGIIKDPLSVDVFLSYKVEAENTFMNICLPLMVYDNLMFMILICLTPVLSEIH